MPGEMSKGASSERQRSQQATDKHGALHRGFIFGWRYPAVEHAGEQRLVATVRLLRGRGLKYREIADRLRAAGKRQRSGKPFTRKSLCMMMSTFKPNLAGTMLTGGGAAPAGYRYGARVPYPPEQRILTEAKLLIDGGHTYEQAAKLLNDAGLVTRHGKPWSFTSLNWAVHRRAA